MITSSIKHTTVRILQCIAFLCLFLAAFGGVVRLVERKQSINKNAAFFDEAAKGHVDVLFAGSSHVINGINPVQIYEETGITSYNIGGHGNTLPATYWTIANALDYCSPQFVFIDTYMLEKDYRYLDEMTDEYTDADRQSSIDQFHAVLDAYPLSKTKLAALNDLLSTQKLRNEFIFNFEKYHSRWSELSRNDFETAAGRGGRNTLMGAELRFDTGSGSIRTYPRVFQEDRQESESEGTAYLRKIIELCQARGIHPILMQVPYAADEDSQRWANHAYDIAGEYDIPFVNMMYVKDLINMSSDLSSQTHLSSYGSYKVTEYMADVLSTLGLTDHRGDTDYAEWDSLVDSYHESVRNAAAGAEDLYSELMLLQYRDLSSVIFVNDSTNVLMDSLVREELADLGAGDAMDTAAKKGRSCVLIRDAGGPEDGQAAVPGEAEANGSADSAEGNANSPAEASDRSEGCTTTDTDGDSAVTGLETSFGTVSFSSPAAGWNALTVDGNDSIPDELRENLLQYYDDNDVDVQVFVFDSRDGSFLAKLKFNGAGFTRVY